MQIVERPQRISQTNLASFEKFLEEFQVNVIRIFKILLGAM